MKNKPKLSEIELKHRSRHLFIKEGIFSGIKSSLGFRYLSPFAIAINTSNSMVALLGSISGFLGPLSQIWGAKKMEKSPRKEILTKLIFIETLVWLPIIAIAFLYLKNIITNLLPLIFMLIFAFYTIISGLTHPPWFSWIGELVDKKYQGRWFSKRTTIINFMMIIFGVGAAFILDYFKKNSHEILGFILLFFLAALARSFSIPAFKKSYEPKIKITRKNEFSFFDFIKMAPKTNYGKMALFRMSLGFTTSITSSLFAVYILRELGFNYVIYMLITFVPTFFSLLTLTFWGKIGDKYGNYKILLITSIFIPLIPILIILSTSKLYLILVPSIISALSWAGFDLAASNFTYDNVTKKKLALANSYYNLLVGIGIFFGAGLGAILIKSLTITFLNPFIFIFILGGILRGIVVLFWIPKIKEIRKIKKTKISLRNFILKETRPTLVEEAHEIVAIPKYLNEK